MRGDNMGQNTTTATDATFASIVASDTPTLVDFWAEWCGPCKMMDVPLDELAGENSGRLTVAKLNVDENPSTMTAYSVMSIPTLIVFQNGEEKRRFVGARSKSQLQAELSDYMS
jgi:thioredoxin 1